MRETSLSWQKILAQGFTSVAELLHYLELPLTEESLESEKTFPTRVPLGFAQRMQKGNPLDPLLLQVLATGKELVDVYGYDPNPIQELASIPVKGLIHKYQGRVLLTLTGTCAVNCRFCFRRHFPYQDNNPGRKGRKAILDYLAKDKNIKEVILSGGDPLLAADIVFKELIQELEQIPHISTLRIHTRIPIVFPERIEAELLNLLGNSKLKVVIILHCNHPQELDESVRKACALLTAHGCVLLNQSVILAGINDNAAVLAALSEALFDFGILPYYLHVLDKVEGAAHFDLPLDQVKAIFTELRALLPGYLVPRLVCDKAGQKSKTLLL